MTDPKPIREIGMTIPVSAEIMRAMLDQAREVDRWAALSEEEREAERQVRREREERVRAAITGLHQEVCAGLSRKLRAVAELHAPDDPSMPRCRGCDFGGYEGGAPEWPCRTYTLVTGVDYWRVREVREAAAAG